MSGVSLGVHPGEVVLLVGASGCGKSTLLKMANGLIPHYVTGYQYGQVLLEGVPIGEINLHDVARRVGSVFQNPRTQMFNVQVRAELAFAAENLGIDPQRIEAAIERVSHEFHAEHLLERTVFELSGGERQKVACMCASVLDVKAVVLDEPSSNLDVRAIAELSQIVRAWKSQGKAVLVAEHRLYYLLDLVDKVVHIENGRVAHAWTGDEFRALDASSVSALGLRCLRPQDCMPAAARSRCWSHGESDLMQRRAVAGRSVRHSEQEPGPTLPQGRAAQEPGPREGHAYLAGLSCTYGKGKAARRCLDVESLELPLGVPIALIGRNGAGKSTFMRTLCGLAKLATGTCSLPGAPCLDARARLRDSYLVMQDVTSQLFCASVLQEVALSAAGTSAQQVAACHETRACEVLEGLDLAPYAQAHPLALSGGQQQRVSVACACAAGRRIVLFDEPTSGLDARHMREVAALLGDVAAGAGQAGEERLVMVVTHDYEFICACCGYVVRLEGGRVAEAYSLVDEQGQARLREFFWGDSGGSGGSAAQDGKTPSGTLRESCGSLDVSPSEQAE